jgi:hypothetical protein
LFRLFQHIRSIWGKAFVGPLLLPAGYLAVMAVLGRQRPEHVALMLICYVLAFTSARTKRFFVEVVPYFLFLYGYDLVRLGRDSFLRSDRVISCGIRQLEVDWFGFGSGRTPGEWLARWHHPALDLLFAFPYFIFAYFVFIYSAYLYFTDRARMRTYLWAFALANFAAFAIWLALPVAPPWYVHQHGCSVDILAAPSAAGLLRVDAALGISYFKTLYGNSAYVFGAMPSMHCAFPMLGLLSAWPHITWRTKPLHVGYVLMMFTASTYLDHHYLVDGLAGFALAFAAVTVTRWMLAKSEPISAAQSRSSAQATATATNLAMDGSLASPTDLETSGYRPLT